MATFQAKYDGKGCEREKIKIFVPLRSYPTDKDWIGCSDGS